jgi:hypothetical protein
VAVRKIFQDFFRIIADGRQLGPLLFESRDGALQLDQLPFAEGSPVGGTEKEKNGAVRSFQGIESLYPAKLVTSRKSGSPLTDRESNGHQLDGSYLNGIAIECSPDGDRVSQVSDYRFLRLKAVHDPAGIVIQRQLRTRHVLGALRRFGKGFVCVAAAGHKDAGPQSGLCCIVLPSHCEGGYRKKCYQIEEEKRFVVESTLTDSINFRDLPSVFECARTVRLTVSAHKVSEPNVPGISTW